MDVIGYEGLYTIDEQGNVYGKKHKKFLKPHTCKGYLKLSLSKNGIQKIYFIHRLLAIHFIPNTENKPIADHKNGITSDNRIENLRWATVSQNGMNSKKSKNNTTGYVGVSFRKNRNKYKAIIYFNNKEIYIGLYDTALEAHKAYEAKAIELFGEFKREIN